MTLVSGNLPVTADGSRSAGGYAPGYGVQPLQLDPPTADTTAGAGSQLSSVQVVRTNSSSVTALASSYPSGAVPLTGQSGDVAATAAVATLTAVAGKTTYITGFSVTSTGSTSAATVLVAVTGTITGTLTYIYVSVAGATTANTPLLVTFPTPIPASAAATNIVVTCPSLGTGNLHTAVNAYGFNL